jgi:hypothetical protein
MHGRGHHLQRTSLVVQRGHRIGRAIVDDVNHSLGQVGNQSPQEAEQEKQKRPKEPRNLRPSVQLLNDQKTINT